MAQPMIGHLDPAFLAVLDEIQSMLRRVFQSDDAMTVPLSATGSGGMECCLVNFLEPGQRAVIAIQGVFGQRMRDIVTRIGGIPIPVTAEMGRIVPVEQMIDVVERERPDMVALVHAETSTGVAQPIADIAAAARRTGALVVLDCVTSLSGMDVRFDDWAIDIAYSGTQKCLSCPPGLSPVAVGPRALAKLRARARPVPSWYFDLTLIGGYLGAQRVYHHTAPISQLLALHRGLSDVLAEGLLARFDRHRRAHARLVQALAPLGFDMYVDAAHRLPMLNAVVPPYRDEADVRRRLLQRHGIEVGAGLGPLAGKVWRIGLMGENAREESVERLVEALRKLA
jgi:alanine-glyoxylate transaminase/serine-glyoxylate transaminase/serine-pyruvate transaminase